jgi:feruloyl esterase
MGKNQSDWMRLFMAPGMGHCGGGPGVNTFDSIGTLEKWVEKGNRAGTNDGNRSARSHAPDVPVSQYAEYKGSGDLKNAANWACTAPQPERRRSSTERFL